MPLGIAPKAADARSCGTPNDEDSDGQDADLDCGAWRLRADLRARRGAGRRPMPAFQAWALPPTAKCSDIHGQCRTIASSARKVFAQAGNAAFWVAAGAAPRSPLERFALGVFWFHVGRLGWTARAIARLGRAAGAEFWVQRRVASQPKAARGVNWHYDKD
mmetsp:Transcript_80819/g.223557  ORF Transcript_80819/g.223557 Transcript_80819/m.223557 type:complete len:161 (+) Transcript_80819:53-535(+)